MCIDSEEIPQHNVLTPKGFGPVNLEPFIFQSSFLPTPFLILCFGSDWCAGSSDIGTQGFRIWSLKSDLDSFFLEPWLGT